MFVWYKWQLLKKVHTKSSEISKECKTWFNKISNCLSFQGKKGMEEICILKLNPENIGHLTTINKTITWHHCSRFCTNHYCIQLHGMNFIAGFFFYIYKICIEYCKCEFKAPTLFFWNLCKCFKLIWMIGTHKARRPGHCGDYLSMRFCKSYSEVAYKFLSTLNSSCGFFS